MWGKRFTLFWSAVARNSKIVRVKTNKKVLHKKTISPWKFSKQFIYEGIILVNSDYLFIRNVLRRYFYFLLLTINVCYLTFSFNEATKLKYDFWLCAILALLRNAWEILWKFSRVFLWSNSVNKRSTRLLHSFLYSSLTNRFVIKLDHYIIS